MKNILFVLGGLSIGGVETYVVRLAKELKEQGNSIDILLLSGKYDVGLFSQLSKFASVTIIEKVSFLGASSWINSLLPNSNRSDIHYDVVHVVDLLTLAYVYFNRKHYSFTGLSIGIYHSKEICWWRERNIYFRKKMLELYDKNVKLTLFPNESTAEMASNFCGIESSSLHVLPLGISIKNYQNKKPNKKSLKIVSVGRLVDFKIYNAHVISQMPRLREIDNFEYFIYGSGPELASLQLLAKKCGVGKYVHFMGEIEYSELPAVLDGSFCFVGSGTTIIEASAAGIPSVVGIESIVLPLTCGLFSDVVGYSYNEESATTIRLGIFETIQSLHELNDAQYYLVSESHRYKANDFDIEKTSILFLEQSNQQPTFDFSFNRWRALLSFGASILSLGPKALKSRFDSVN
ncbi:glycosyltransferase family 4 protein [Pseudomonas sp. RTC3]|uniref:glycosyltransferase family 4 protein n=1 Tax=unclassified Pseudomonas TaxID=196821 RepID=UPI002AB4BB98|nr:MULTISPECIES: glycosyltransferase family 4 protein [unclassified Pseudomonas]MEB0064159.1 glycosyltransferase family 4 protein [Pseudomonas sp. RTC3]MDY7565984.1 glycosyltransferase family 4 protein [Pseudomonas sp. 5C2]MEB0007617.1 glycosyltransferase family 4 protein [Pseudomonas sp. RTB2]MEB0018844.1 glycosyltransferase family 4 protein [Pseudomonas sp. RTB3]MEB0239330.1 glycosyltransferase family 4 protein [Pseudomonas sp. 5C2]